MLGQGSSDLYKFLSLIYKIKELKKCLSYVSSAHYLELRHGKVGIEGETAE